MQKIYFLILSLLFVFPLFAQIEFKSGFYVDNEGDTIKCLIKDTDWESCPVSFDMKMHPESSIKTMLINDVQLFGIDTSLLYLKSPVMIDTSGIDLSNISNHRNPEWKEMQVFLKVLLLGEASLYLYRQGNFIRYFYSIKQGEIKQLVYKEFYTTALTGRTGMYMFSNLQYQQDLQNEVNCNSTIEVTRLNYTQRDLLKYFRNYNSCIGYPFVDFKEKYQRNYFNFKVVFGVNSAFIEGENTSSNTSFSFDRKFGYEFGFEAEGILPLNRDKIRIVVSPTFQSFESSTEFIYRYNYTSDATVVYKAIELPVGIRYYFFLTDKAKIYLSGLFVQSINFKSSNLEITSILAQAQDQLNLKSASPNLSFGIGASYQRLSFEFRANTRREIDQYELHKHIGFHNYSFRLGYDLFKF